MAAYQNLKPNDRALKRSEIASVTAMLVDHLPAPITTPETQRATDARANQLLSTDHWHLKDTAVRGCAKMARFEQKNQHDNIGSDQLSRKASANCVKAQSADWGAVAVSG